MNNSKNDDESKDIKKGWFIAGIITISLAILLPFFIIVISRTTFSVSKLGELGAVGDFFGGSTIGLLSIASIFFIIHTISIQSKELSLQRMELQYTRDELKQTRKVHEESNRTQINQRFETTFFNMISLQKEIVNNLSIGEGVSKNTGRNVTYILYVKFLSHFQSPPSSISGKVRAEKSNVKNQSNIIFSNFIDSYGDIIGPYFRNLQVMINFVDRSDLTFKEKKDYLEILKAQISKSEMRIIFYYSTSNYGNDLIDLLLKYDFFQGNLKPEDLIHAEHYNFIEK